MAIDLFNLEEVKINTGLEGKIILVYSTNNCGKSLVASQLFPGQTLFLATERGYNALKGIKKVDILDWSTFRNVVSELTGKKNKEKLQEIYKCVVIDVADRLPAYCESYICQKNMVDNIADIEWGGGYSQLKNEFDNQINKLALSGYCLILLCHEQYEEHSEIVNGKEYKFQYAYPKNTFSKVGAPLKDIPDFTIWLKNNNTDENGQVILSTAYLSQQKEAFARSRFPACPTTIRPFTAKGLKDAIKTACEAQADNEGITFKQEEEQRNNEQNRMKKTREELVNDIKPYLTAAIKIYPNECGQICAKHLGGKRITDETNPIDKLQFVYDELADFCESKNIIID